MGEGAISVKNFRDEGADADHRERWASRDPGVCGGRGDANCGCGVSVFAECFGNNMAQPELGPNGARAVGHIPAELCKLWPSQRQQAP